MAHAGAPRTRRGFRPGLRGRRPPRAARPAGLRAPEAGALTSPPTPPLPTLEAYRLWAATYDEENPLTALDTLAASLLTPPLDGTSLLDAACGTARRLVFGNGARPARAFGVDLVFEMLHRGRRSARRARGTAAADLAALPFPADRFGVVWCRLAAGHLPRLAPLYRELARVLLPGGRAVVTDFHPAAIRAGHRRIFRDAGGTGHEVTHVVHEPDDHEREAVRAGLAFEARLDYGIGAEVRRFWEKAGALDRYARDRGLPLLLAFRFRK